LGGKKRETKPREEEEPHTGNGECEWTEYP